MSSADFRHIAVKGKARREERLFRAAVSAFCALTRPTRSEIAQMEALTLPLFDAQPKDSRRFAAAALSEAAQSPNALVRRLCDEPVDVAAPLLIRSKALSDVDLVTLVSRHGISHARAIARREDLHPAIAALIRALEAQHSIRDELTEEIIMPQDAPAVHRPVEIATPPLEAPGAAAERMRDRLRVVMAPAASLSPELAQTGRGAPPYLRLKSTALADNPALFQTALADALDIDFSIARDIATAAGYTSLIAAFRALDLSEEEALLVTSAVFPTFFADTAAIRRFIERYRQLDRAAALDMLSGWRAETASRRFQRSRPSADNSDARPSGITRLRTSRP